MGELWRPGQAAHGSTTPSAVRTTLVFRGASPRRPHFGRDEHLSSGPCRPGVRGTNGDRAMTSSVQDGDGMRADGPVLTPEVAEGLGALYARIVESVQSVLYADDEMVQLAVGCLLAEGHLLVED